MPSRSTFSGEGKKLGAQGKVALLNEYFTIMVDCISGEGRRHYRDGDWDKAVKSFKDWNGG